ncbi:MAG: hypothetical protein ACJ76N_07055 [Thermoanaerobaculia bacterium]
MAGFLTAGFLNLLIPPAEYEECRLAEDFLAADVLAAVFLAATFIAEAFLAGAFFAEAFFDGADRLAEVFLAAAFFAPIFAAARLPPLFVTRAMTGSLPGPLLESAFL